MSPSTDQINQADIESELIEEMAAFAGELAAAAATETLPAFRNSGPVENKAQGQDFDPVTAADQAAERAIRTLIEKRYPDHGIIGEEWDNKDGTSPFAWILDPIDGTRGYIAGIPAWTTLIGLTYEQRPVLGLIDQPYIGERFVGIDTLERREAWLERGGTRATITTSDCSSLAEAILTSTTPDLFNAQELARFDTVKDAARLTRYGLDAYGYALIAIGTIDVVVEAGLAPYDIQPLIPVIHGAGGVVTNWDGELPLKGGQILAASSAELHSAALSRLKV